MNCTIVMYHYTRDLKHSRYPEIKGLDVPLFRQQLEFFKANYNVIQMEQLIASIKSGEPLPEKALLLTFDDGYIDNYTFALPLLEEFGFQGSFFIPGKTFATHQLLDVNKIHYILASTDAKTLMESLLNHLNFYRGTEFAYPSNEELFEKYAVANRFDPKEIRWKSGSSSAYCRQESPKRPGTEFPATFSKSTSGSPRSSWPGNSI